MNPDIGRRLPKNPKKKFSMSFAMPTWFLSLVVWAAALALVLLQSLPSLRRKLESSLWQLLPNHLPLKAPSDWRLPTKGMEQLAHHVDTIIAIPNDRILQIIDKKTSLLDAFKTVDDVLRQGVAGISDLITTPGMINVDFADVRSIMQNAGSAPHGYRPWYW
jgi:hypothetical protein